MTNQATESPIPTEIDLHQQTGVLELHFSDASAYRLAAPEVRASSELLKAKKGLRITRIIAAGNSAIRLVLNDGVCIPGLRCTSWAPARPASGRNTCSGWKPPE